MIGDSGSPVSSGTLSITNGGAVSYVGGVLCYLGYNHNSAGTVTVDGAGSNWTMDASVFVGWGGSGR